MHAVFCFLAFVFIFASIFTMFTCETCYPFDKYKQTLGQSDNGKLLQLYKVVVQERASIALNGLILGFILGFIYIYFCQKSFNFIINACAFTRIILGTQYLVYMLSPKMSMLPHLENKQQVQSWYEVYKFMQWRYHTGMLLGVVGYFILGCWITKSK